ncbi:PREDICTED: tRNA-specific adenosine deaminase 1 [Papilio xuthus]|uniref:tRNA-specific adenosine deaminase 1 n=1 Tax=Papilio xuthus TaxID=66420 RepID=A0AAJ7E614_PAPXU|nr:PREDICTED: tRNA-specific adenosine deaminase 1 [Papilio xuthus]
MEALSKELVDKIALECIELYRKVPKIGKPAAGEWNVLSSVVRLNTETQKFDVVSLGTGSKCIGATKMSPEGVKVHDSHAEVFARRGFMLYIYKNLEMAITSPEESIFIKENGKFRLKENIQFIFYSSQMPCGDASIIPKSNDNNHGNVVTSRKREAEDGHDEEERKILKSDDIDDIHRTGAKCLPHNEQDPKEPGAKYHLLGQVRTKPGLGDRTLSVSCSDKIARWIHVGIQGALLDMLLTEPIYIKHFIFGGGVPYSKESLTRAFLNRNGEEQITVPVIPYIYQATAIFYYMKSEQRARPAHTSILVFNFGLVEVAVHGKRIGVTKKMERTRRIALSISKYYLYRRFLFLFQLDPSLKEKYALDKLECIPYNVMKRKSQRYYENWHKAKENFFKSWTVKPDMWSFCITEDELAVNVIELNKMIHYTDPRRSIMIPNFDTPIVF